MAAPGTPLERIGPLPGVEHVIAVGAGKGGVGKAGVLNAGEESAHAQ